MEVPSAIIWVDCGCFCRILSFEEPDEGFQSGDVVAYRCRDCLDRWDIVIEDGDDDS